MILHKMTVENFRQFRGRQEIEFLSPASPNCNVTVVFGENGRGKTGLFRAIMFCLFGERRLTQDGDVPREELQLVNVSALEATPEQPVRTSVELTFSHKGSTYQLRRTIRGIRDGGQVIEEEYEKRLHIVAPNGNTIPVEPTEVDGIINNILDRRVKDYFLFDGEKIERLTRASIEQKKEISAGIRNLLNVDALEVAIKALKRLVKQLDEQVADTAASANLARLMKQLGDVEEEQNTLRMRLDQLADEIGKARREIEETDRELDKFKDIRHLLDRRKQLEQDLQGLERQAKDLLAEMRNHVCRTAALMVAPTVISVFDFIEHQKQRGEIPSEIRKDLIQRILDEKLCICGREVCDGTDPYRHIIEWLQRTSDVTVQDAALNLWRYLGDVRNHYSDDATLVESRLLQYSNIRNSIVNTNRNLDHLREQIGTSERQDATKLEDQRKLLQDGIITLEAEVKNLQARQATLSQEHDRLQALLREEKLKVGRNDELTKRLILARDTYEALTNVYDQFTKEIKDLIGESATQIFRNLLDHAGRENLRTIIVDDDYSLQVLDRWGKRFLANISAGQRQIMSISFIAALAQAASHGHKIEMPLFMDTPFGRLSYDHRQNLITQVPSFASQWILLATDTEFRRQEAQLLKASGKWGRFFMLHANSDGNTTIEEHDISSVQAILRDEEDLQ